MELTRSQARRGRRYLDPMLLSKLANMNLVARCAVEGLLVGLHRSPFHGFSVEYSDHREYHPGDELKFLDWKIFGRSDKLYIKQFHQETNVAVYILLDSSRSMSFAGKDSVSKLEYGSFLAAALSYLMMRQCDAAGLVLFAETIRKVVPPSAKQAHLNAILTALQNNRARGRTHLGAVLHAVAETTTRRGIVIVISDLLDDRDDIHKGLMHLKYLQHDVIVFHTLDHQELNLDYDGLIQFEDLESNARIRTFPQSLHGRYCRRVAGFIDDLKKTAGNSRIDYCLLDTSQLLDVALIRYLSRRKRLM